MLTVREAGLTVCTDGPDVSTVDGWEQYMGVVRRAVLASLTAVLVGLGLLAVPVTAAAAEGDIGFEGPSYTGVANPPTADKPQSKLWFHDGSWWAHMFDTGTQD